MPGTKTIVLPIESLISLLQHYTEGRVPLDVELKSFGVHPTLTRLLGLELTSSQWADPMGPDDHLPPLVIRYEGRKTLAWGEKGTDPTWNPGVTKA